MTLYEELYFDITLTGAKSDLKNFVSYLKSGELDEFFEIQSDYFDFDDEYESALPTSQVSLIFTNDDIGIEIDEFDTDEFLEVFCMAGRALDMKGVLYDADEEEYEFYSEAGNSYYVNAKRKAAIGFNEDMED